MRPCPDKPNCVCSDATDPRHAIAPLAFECPAGAAWAAAARALRRLPRTTIVESTENRMHAECRTLVFRWVDDVELELDAARRVIAVRSASRVGHSDFGTNRRRVETLRRLFAEEAQAAR